MQLLQEELYQLIFMHSFHIPSDGTLASIKVQRPIDLRSFICLVMEHDVWSRVI